MIRFLQQGGSVTRVEIKPLRKLANLPTTTKQQKLCPKRREFLHAFEIISDLGGL
jgi:hypothetical protein